MWSPWNGYDLVAGRMSLGVVFEVSKAHARRLLSLFACCLRMSSSQLLLQHHASLPSSLP